ncbi:hypothetical protein GCM10010435_40630 [Winogradskya consettensis]|uniref:Uncharacterized protein n=1 Tax=Winogradskya consettensis TaxID=113560 RepID=A0A919VKP3_9ACTN|nr:hypothetical protein [Actinoplanes consettensis]GIM69744.1 hypothetical protein Aco04nite_16760 [Actinoplanes consettensis]
MLKTKRTIAPDDPRAPDARHFAERLRNAVANTPRDLPVDGLDRIPGADVSDTVTCFVNVHGDFVDLNLQSDWWYTVGPSGVAAAVLDALAFAQEKSSIAMAILGHYHRRVEERDDNPFSFLQTADVPYSRDPESEIAEAYEKVRRTASLVDVADRMSRRRETAQQRVIAGPRGFFRLTMAGFELQHADVDENALSASDAGLLAEDARAALVQATRENDPRYWFAREVVG